MPKPYLTPDNVDDLGRMVVALLSELWVTRDRLAVAEALLAQKGVLTAEEIEAFQPDPELAAQIDATRDRMVASVLGAPIAGTDRTVDAILERAGFSRTPDSAVKFPA